jgi:hypothetical protein|tara:strand:+ start:6520 stop:6957 length:438 start_codon:yes stop_codon:yes gene_type:complete
MSNYDIQHRPVYDTKKVENLYTEKDGTPVSYVCTTDLLASDQPVDIFYRSTPHPEFGNYYFGLYTNHYAEKAQIMITNADMVEDFEFGMIKDESDKYHYSQSHHDCRWIGDKMIDGGRRYIRASGGVDEFKIKDGTFIKTSSRKE